MTDHAIKAWGMRLMLPLLLANVTASNQDWRVGPLLVSQFLLFWPGIIAAFAIVLVHWGPRSLLPWLLLGSLFAGRAIGANQAGGAVYLVYGVPLLGLFALAGAVIALERRDLLMTQLKVYFALSVPLMLLQVGGAGAWTLALNTETTAVGDFDPNLASRDVFPTLFVPYTENGRFAVGQSRPAGLTHANNILSLILMFALAVNFGRIRGRRITAMDVLLVAAMVLAMAKIVVLSFVLMVFWLLLRGSRVARARMRKVLILTAALYGLYALLFPGLFFHHVDPYHLTYSVYIRLNDFAAALDPDNPIARYLNERLRDTPVLETEDPTTRLSGYAMIADLLPVLAVATPIIFIISRRALRTIRRRMSGGDDAPGLVALVVLLIPAAVPIWSSTLFWFVVGVAVMPLLWVYGRQPQSGVVRPAGDTT